MKKLITLVLALICVLSLVGCNKSTASDEAIVGGDRRPMVMVDGKIYLETEKSKGELLTSDVIDGKIPSEVDRSEIPTQNDQSNFGTGYSYRYGEEGTVEIVINGKWWVFEAEQTKDIIPTISDASQMKYSEVNDALTGKNIKDIREAWGEPVESDDKEDVWQLDESMLLFITYNDTGIIESCELVCGTPLAPVEIPEDFSFALVWNCYGISSYDSQTGKLVKATDATNPEDYITYYQLTDEDKEYIYNLLVSLDAKSYPDIYDPKSGMSEPPMTLILTVRENGEVKTIKAENISLTFKSEDEKGQVFLSVCGEICRLLTTTDEWKALPAYEKLYE